ncbi:hypothetical protein HATV-3_gp37 [Haloarcula tailed virus 3]|jgi:hypothetical protein|uniref:Uncharacterized protein n=1 Tax=Haloarcula tailed virus 3 TaxID=2877990 RepID=A0AAE8XZ32_9CAUD|nr:hypothetical protein M1M35_gp37 [Haloarcula tailed virus 3]UBF23387.1 hypothetical protein HATV-3_gp37 [Haloarcula tailed virus 3]
MTKSVKVPDPVHSKAEEVQEEYDYSTLGEAVRHMCRHGDYDV